MTNLTHAKEKLYPKFGIIVYGGDYQSQEKYLEYFDVDNNFNTTNHRPITNELAKGFQLIDHKIPVITCKKLFTDITLIRCGQDLNGTYMTFYHGPRKFNIKSTTEHIPSGTYKFPATIYKYNNGNLTVAMMDTNKLTKKTHFFYPPFYNTYANGQRCTGNFNMSKIADLTDFYEIAQAVISLAWDNTFNDHLAVEKRFAIPLKEIYEKQEFIKYSQNLDFKP